MAIAVGVASMTLTGTMFTGSPDSARAVRLLFSPAPGEQHVGVQAVAARHLRNGRGRRKALRNDPLLLNSWPSASPALAAIRAWLSDVRHLR